VKRWIERWNAYWFPTTSTVPLAICRILMVAARLFWLTSTMPEQYNLLARNSTFITPQLLIRAVTAVVPRDMLFTSSGFHALYWITVVAGVLALIGLFTRVSLFVFALANWIFIAHLYSYSDIHHPEAVFSILLMLLPFAPSGDSLSIDSLLRRRRAGAAGGRTLSHQSDMAMWPLKTAHALMALTYFSTGLTKLVFGGFRWMNGYTLQAYLLADGLRRDIPFGVWMAQHRTLCVLLSIGTVVFELSFCISLIRPRTAPLFFLGGLFFQIGLLVTAGHHFYPHIYVLLLLLFLIEPGWWQSPVRKYFGFRIAWAGPELSAERAA
jgi:uncharacterized membrane protein YphA (DoxX/SURF4 family)